MMLMIGLGLGDFRFISGFGIGIGDLVSLGLGWRDGWEDMI